MIAINVYNPAKPSEVVWTGNETGIETIPAMLSKAKAAQKSFAHLSGRQRYTIISNFLDALEKRSSDIAERMILEQGKLAGEAAGEVAKSLTEARWMLGRCLEQVGEVMASMRPDVKAMKLRRPRGVILAITPWNFPILTPLRKVIPALVFGNAIVLKPSSDAPGAATILYDVACETLPAHLVTILYGGSKVANAAILSEDIAAVTFTGSTDVGKLVMASAAQGLKEVSLELGGKNAVIVHDPENLDVALDHIVRSAFANAGQRCTAVSRVLAHEKIRHDVIEGLKRRIATLRPGAGHDARSTLAPLSTKGQFEKVASVVSDLQPAQASILIGGKPAKNDNGGYFFEPTLVEVHEKDCFLNTEEVFGPVLGLEFYQDVQEAIERVNDTPYGLSASVFSSSLSVVRAFEEGIETGMLHINHGTFPDENMPFGGWKASGIGAASVGAEAAQFFTRVQAVYEGL